MPQTKHGSIPFVPAEAVAGSNTPVSWCQRSLIGELESAPSLPASWLSDLLWEWRACDKCRFPHCRVGSGWVPILASRIVSEEAQCSFRAVTIVHRTVKTGGDPQHHCWAGITRNLLRGIYRCQWKTQTSASTQ